MNEYIKGIYELITPKGLFMLGAKDVCFDNKENSLSFKIRGSQKANYIKVIYDCSKDLYNVVIMKYSVRKFEMKVSYEETINGLYNDMIRETITEKTGLFLSI